MVKNKLESVMRLNGETGSDLSKVLGISRCTFSLKLNEKNGSAFTIEEIKRIRDHYNIEKDDLFEIFFT